MIAGSPPGPEDLIGIWTLVSVEVPTEGGGTERPFGTRPTGSIFYLSNGTMAVHISGSEGGRIRAYAGAWRIEGSRVVHEVELSLEPHLRGARLERESWLEGTRLTYRTVEAQGPGHPVVVWQRVP